MSGDEKPPIARLGSLASKADGKRLGSLRDSGEAGPSSSAKPSFASRFKPKNFARPAAPAPADDGDEAVAEEERGEVSAKHAELLEAAEADKNLRRGRRRGAAAGPRPAAQGQVHEVAFGGALDELEQARRGGGGGSGGGAGGSSKASGSKSAKSAGETGASAAPRKPGAGGATRAVKDEAMKTEVSTSSSSEDSSSSESDEDLINENEYYPTLLYARDENAGAAAAPAEDPMEESEEKLKAMMSKLAFLADPNSEERLLLFQLPSLLPIAAPDGAGFDPDQPGTSAAAAAGGGAGAGDRPASLDELGSGTLGKLLVFKSGAIKARIGDVLFDVTPGVDCRFRQEAAWVSTETKECIMLGDIRQSVVITPDIQHILSGEPIPDYRREALEPKPEAPAPEPAAAQSPPAAAAAPARKRHVIDSDEEEEGGAAAAGDAAAAAPVKEEEIDEEEEFGAVAMDVDADQAAAPQRGRLTKLRHAAKGEAKEEDAGPPPPKRDPRRSRKP